MPFVSLSNGRGFEAATDVSLLSAAAAANVSLPYSCKTGRCSTCKCKVLSGTTVALNTETGLSKQELADGWILSCVRAASTDVTIEAEDLGGITLPAAKTWPCRINQINHLAPDVVQVHLRLPPTADFQFLAGQYINVIGPNGIRRSYSLANANFTNKVLELHIRAVEGGAMSQYWFSQAKLNDMLRLNGPLGTFFLRETTNINLVFLATGTGIAPVKAILESLVHLPAEQLPKSIAVFWGGRKKQDLYFDLSSTPVVHTYVPVLSRSDENWCGAKGHVQNELLKQMPNLTNAVVYACGSDAMIHSAKAQLVAAGLPANHFYSDAFVSSGT